MMRVFIGFDDTDNIDASYGTGKVVRWFEEELPQGSRMWGVVRQQLLVDEAVPYTSHNSSACMIVDLEDESLLEGLIERAVAHIERLSLDGSDPGLCVVCENSPALKALMEFGKRCVTTVVSQKEALQAASGIHLSGHGGTNDGIIGASAGVGLSAHGFSGRFIEFGRLRNFADPVRVSDLQVKGIMPVSLDREALALTPDDIIHTNGWLRPRLWAGKAILPVNLNGDNTWVALGRKHRQGKMSASAGGSNASVNTALT